MLNLHENSDLYLVNFTGILLYRKSIRGVAGPIDTALEFFALKSFLNEELLILINTMLCFVDMPSVDRTLTRHILCSGCRLAVIYRIFGTESLSVSYSRVKVEYGLSLNTGPIFSPEKSINNYHSKPRNVPEERRYHLHRCGSLRSRNLH